MSSFIKNVASVALPIVGNFLLPGIGGVLGGAAGGLISGGGLKGALTGAALGGVGSLFSGGPGIIGGTASALNSAGFGNAAYELSQAADSGTGIIGSLAKAGSAIGSIGSKLFSGVGGASGSSVLPLASVVGGIYQAKTGADAAKEAAQTQSNSADKAIAAEQGAQAKQQAIEAPYVTAGDNSLQEYQSLTASPAAEKEYIMNNPLYTSLADDAARRLTASQAAAGKLASGGTANALQSQLLNLGSGLLETHLGDLRSTIGTGANAAAGVGSGVLNTGSNVAGLDTQQGNVQAAGSVGAYNAQNSAYQNTINTLLALQKLNLPAVPQYNPSYVNI